MNLEAFLADTLARPVDPTVRSIAAILADEVDADAILFYGSNLRSRALTGVLDFYVLTPGPREHGFWPTVSYREFAVDGTVVRAKIATIRMATFACAASNRTLDTTIWARFAQPSAVVWIRNGDMMQRTLSAIAGAATTAGRYAAALGPDSGTAGDYWRSLFAATYRAELRIERKGRHDQLVMNDLDYYEALLPLAWACGDVPFDKRAGQLQVNLTGATALRLRIGWMLRRLAGKPINIARLIRATLTFDGAARYGAWKIERHTGIRVAMTPWRERHPVLAAPGVLWQVWRSSGQRSGQ